MALRIGTAGWALRKEQKLYAGPGTHLERYARHFRCVEINSSFYRPHQRKTYERWAASVPAAFRFSVKVPKQITHQQRLVACSGLLQKFLAEVSGLGEKLGPLLVQLPPGLVWNKTTTDAFWTTWRDRHAGVVVCEPRHLSWFDPEPTRQFEQFRIGRVAADPAVTPAAALPGGFGESQYFRLHGSPRMYYSSYSDEFLAGLAKSLVEGANTGHELYCIFDNTAEFAAISNALDLSWRCELESGRLA